MILSDIEGVGRVDRRSQQLRNMTQTVVVIAEIGGNMIKKVEIESKPTKTLIFVDGKLVHGVTKFNIRQKVGEEIPTIEMECITNELNLDFQVADVKFVFNGQWIDCEKCLPNLEEPVLALVRDKFGLHQEVLTLKHFEESDALYEGDYWCSYRTINVEALGMCKVLAWQGLPPTEDYVQRDD